MYEIRCHHLFMYCAIVRLQIIAIDTLNLIRRNFLFARFELFNLANYNHRKTIVLFKKNIDTLICCS